MRRSFLFLTIISLLTISGMSFAANGIDSDGTDLPINAGGNLVATMKTTGDAVFAKNVTANGGVKVGTVNLACSGAIAGMMRYNNKLIEYCDGTSWVKVGAAETPAPVTHANCPETLIPNTVLLPPGVHGQQYADQHVTLSGGNADWGGIPSYSYTYYQCIDGRWVQTS